MTRLRRFVAESWSELKKVTWPTRLQVRNLTVLVFVVSFAVGVYHHRSSTHVFQGSSASSSDTGV